MAKNPGPVKRGTRWYLRVRVPEDLVGRIGRKEISKSLGTGDHRKAKVRYLEERAKIERQFAAARDGLEALEEADIQRMVVQWFDGEDRQWAEADFAAFGNGQRDALDDAHDWEMTLLAGADAEVMPHVQAVADAILIGNGWPGRPHRVGAVTAVGVQIAEVDKTSRNYQSLVGHVRRAMLETARRHRARLGGSPAGLAFDQAFMGVGAGVGRQVTTPVPQVSSTAPPLTDVFEKWKAERKPVSKTAHEWATAIRRFTEVCGDLPVDAITTVNVRDFKDALLKLPAVTNKGLHGKTVRQIIAATKGNDVPTLSTGTVNKQLTAVRACRKNDYVETNVAAGLSVPKSKNACGRRLPYSANDMQVLLAGLGERRDKEPAKFWLPLLAAFTGARLEELGQLRVADVRCRDGTHFIDINEDEDGKRLKTRSSRREVPVHPELVRCGFLGHVEQCRSAGGGLLFPDLKPDVHGTLTGNWSKWWGHHARRRGVTDRRKVFHSFRHGFKQALERGGLITRFSRKFVATQSDVCFGNDPHAVKSVYMNV